MRLNIQKYFLLPIRENRLFANVISIIPYEFRRKLSAK